ncbi:TetR/AcrR family transcriptional regulator [Curtobacterium sp. ISL-83]|uniref:TetR/AcrR family transcriptional regulator n=1 Tax=Curtobacterium sp. ISL-83 TaxID=2819145 RepID=UPI001BEAFF9A|nr:TetR/AcrR family transcriptional regulator [Curtobacterium sp. ISL-83]MBT2501257.1 helix-turn-helix transcriptional regulator [Curtobacterium sp. ISL-83]
MPTTPPRADAPPTTPLRGRPVDRSSDAVILAATLDLLAEHPYDRVTLDEVAARTGKAKTTLYRRWATKEDLVLAAVTSAGRPPEVDALPDRGDLRADLLAVIDSPWLGGADRRLAVLAGLATAARSSARLADAVRSEIAEPYVEIYRRLLLRALDRGRVPEQAGARVEVLAEVIPAMSTHRLGTSPTGVDRAFFVAVVDDVVLPALR